MFGEFLARSNLLVWPLVGFVIFFVTFLAVLVSVFRKRRGSLDRLAALPLDDDATGSAPAARERAFTHGARATSGGE